MVQLVVVGSETGNLSEFKVAERFVCERVRGPEYGRVREGEKNMLKRREKEKYMCMCVLSTTNWPLPLALTVYLYKDLVMCCYSC